MKAIDISLISVLIGFYILEQSFLPLQEMTKYDDKKKVHCYFCIIIQIEILNMLFLQVKQLGNCLILSGIEDEDIYDSTVSLYMHTTEY